MKKVKQLASVNFVKDAEGTDELIKSFCESNGFAFECYSDGEATNGQKAYAIFKVLE